MEDFSQVGNMSSSGNQGNHGDGSIPNSFVSSQSGSATQAVDKLYTKNEVSQIVNRTLQERNQRDARLASDQPGYYNEKYAAQKASGLSEAEIERKIRLEFEAQNQRQYEQAVSQRLQQRANNIERSFDKKAQEAASKYSDFNQKVNKQELINNYPFAFAQIMENLDNADDVLYHLANNPLDFMKINDSAARDESTGSTAALKALKYISTNLKQNIAPAEYSQEQSSPTYEERPAQQAFNSGYQPYQVPMGANGMPLYTNPNAFDPTQVRDHGDTITMGNFGTTMNGDEMFNMLSVPNQQQGFNQNNISDMNHNYGRNLTSSPNIRPNAGREKPNPMESLSIRELAANFSKARNAKR
jgi:hypothetical protein